MRGWEDRKTPAREQNRLPDHGQPTYPGLGLRVLTHSHMPVPQAGSKNIVQVAHQHFSFEHFLRLPGRCSCAPAPISFTARRSPISAGSQPSPTKMTTSHYEDPIHRISSTEQSQSRSRV